MKTYDKASWHIDGGEKESAVVSRFKTLFLFLADKNMLNAVITISIVTFLIYPVGFRSAYIMFDDGTDALNGVLKLLINIVIRQCLLAVLFASALIFKNK